MFSQSFSYLFKESFNNWPLRQYNPIFEGLVTRLMGFYCRYVKMDLQMVTLKMNIHFFFHPNLSNNLCVAAKKTRHINLQQSILICNPHLMAINKVALCVVKTEINTNRTNINKAKIAQNKTRESRKLTFVIWCWLQKAEMTSTALKCFDYYCPLIRAARTKQSKNALLTS